MAVEKQVTLLEIDIDNSLVIKKQGDLIKQIETLKKSQKSLKKDTDGLTTATDKQTKQYVKNETEIKNLQGESRKYSKVLQDQSKAQESNRKIIKATDGSINSLRNALNVNKTTYKTLTKAQRENDQIGGKLLKTINAQDEEYKELSRSIGNNQVDVGNYKLALEGLEKELKNAVKSQKKIAEVSGKASKEYKEAKTVVNNYNTQINQLNQTINVNSKEQKKATESTNNYGSSVNDLTSNISIMGVNVGQVVGNLKAKRKALKGTVNGLKGASKGLRLFRIALISTGIGAIVVAIGSLVTAFASTQKGADAISRALAPVKGAFQGIISVVQKISTVVFGGLGDKFTIVKNVILNGIDAIRLGWNNLTGDIEEANEIQKRMDDRIKETDKAQQRLNASAGELKDIFKNAGKEISEASRRQSEIVELGIKAEQLAISNVKAQGLLNKEIKLQNKIAEDVTNSFQEREDATIRSITASKKLLKSEQDLIGVKIKQLKLEQSQTDTSRDDLLELANLQKEFNDKETQALELQTTQTNKLNIIRNQIIAKQKQAQAERRKRLEAELSLTETIANKNIELLNQELDIFLANNESKLGDSKRITDALIKNEEDRLNFVFEKKKEINKKSLDSELKALDNELLLKNISEEEGLKEREIINNKFKLSQIESEKEFNNAKLDLNKSFNEQKKAEKEKEKETKIAEDVAEFQNKITRLQLEGATELEIKLAQLEAQKQLEINKAKELGVEKSLVLAKFADKELRIREAVELAKTQAIGQAIGQAKSLFAENTVAYKALAITEASIATYLAATKALTALPNPIAYVNAGVAIATGLGNVKKIAGFAEGSESMGSYAVNDLSNHTGIISGTPNISRSNGDNMLATVKTGEAILNNEQQSKINGWLGFNGINRAVNGYADGTTFASPSVTNTINRNVVNNSTISNGKINQGIELIVDVKDIVRSTNELDTKVQDATI